MLVIWIDRRIKMQLQLTFQSLLLNHGVGSFSHCLVQSFAAHLVQPA